MYSSTGFHSLRTWISAGLLSAVAVACGGGNEGRDPVLGTNGNVALTPTVTATTPADGEIGVAIDIAAITATFSQPMAPLPGDSSFTVTCAAPCTSPTGDVTLDAAGTLASFTLSAPLEEGTLYTATVSGATSAASGLALEGPFTWTFSTIGPAPSVTGVTPVNNATGVAINNTVIAAQFSEPVDALTAEDFTVTCADPCTDAVGTVTMNASGRTATFAVTEPETLEEQTQYTATIVTATSTASGQTLAAPFVWQFTTGVTPDTTKPRVTLTEPVTATPGPTTGVPTNTAISAVFSEAMAPTTIGNESFTLVCEAPCVSPTGTVSYDVASRTAVFAPAAELESGVTYTATIVSTVTDLAGNRLAGNQAPITEPNDYVWTFTTEVAVAADNITVTATEPMNGGMLTVCPVAGISATFDVPSGLRIDPLTANSMTFTVVEDATPDNAVVAESVVVDTATGTIVTFTPSAELTEGLVYRATLASGAGGVTDLAVPANELVEDFVWTFSAVAAPDSCVQPVALGSAAPFGTFGGSAGVTNDGLLTIINGDIGTTAASTLVTGLVDALDTDCAYTVTPLNRGLVNGGIFTAPPPPTVACPQDGTAETEAIANQARLDAEAAFIALSPAALPGGQDPGNDNLANLTLIPGVYTAQSGSFRIQGGDLTLDGQGNQNAVWVFQMATTLTVGGPGAAFPQSVTLVNGAQAKNVFWQVGSAATINAAGGGTMKGTIIASDGVSISTAGNNAPEQIVTLDGRALSLVASVTIVNTIINVPAP